MNGSDFSPEAYCDAVSILIDAPASLLPMSIIELHLFSYLGSILSLFQGRPLGDLGYSYVVTTEGFPFSVQLEDARALLVSSGLILIDDQGYMQPRFPEIEAEYQELLTLRSLSERRALFNAATQCALALPIGSIRHAVSQSPGMASAIDLGHRSDLFNPDDVSLLYDEYKIVRSVLSQDSKDILAPAVIWLSARIMRGEGDLNEV
ncbi:hypothetical protein [Pseudomonas gingeri]|uniref:hypothetical protein n=1 Tax=Pseudomonas gingeri TaxID=117681 RepID=UPI0015A0436C|nr:hypothetical protein [Pseudomonas gingeri]NWD08948.1 hypothetical protein [Pseudomonas gingeri]NWE34779.1 hypothetical protein [Pseudomonas gingeri]NWE56880.1 hypothetical protein [Pseudomonas gingeri]NWF02019.1 hypothetical protein [Pseudomonas gingeri]